MAKQIVKSVLFLCTGNYYRSRFAEIYFNSVSAKMGLPWKASSKALALERGSGNFGPMSVMALEALETLGVNAAEDCARFPVQATLADFEQAARIVALKQAEHLPLLMERFPAWVDKVEFWHIDDAPGVLPLIEQEITNFVARILGGGQPEPPEQPPASNPVPKAITVKVGRETKGRRGKGVTTVSDIPLDDAGLLDLAGVLKQKCGTGGTVKDGRIEIQGDQRVRLAAVLESMGYQVKRVGG